MSGAEPLLVNAPQSNGFLAGLRQTRRSDMEADDGGLSLVRPPIAGAIASKDSSEAAQPLPQARQLLAVDECYAEIYTGGRSGRARGRARESTRRRQGPVPQLVVFHSLSKRSNAAGLRSGFVAGRSQDVAMILRWRTYGGPQIPIAVQKASVALWRDEAHPPIARLVREELQDRRADPAQPFGYYTPGGGFFLWLDVGDAKTPRETVARGACEVLPAPMPAADRRRQQPPSLHPRGAGARRENHARGLGRLASVVRQRQWP